MKQTLLTSIFALISFSAFAHDDDGMQATQYFHRTVQHLHNVVNAARDTLISDLRKSADEADNDPGLINKVLIDQGNLNIALHHLYDFEENGR